MVRFTLRLTKILEAIVCSLYNQALPQLMIILWNFYCVLMLLEDLLQKHHGRHTVFWLRKTRQKSVPRTSISAKLVSNLITNAGAHRVVTVDLHAGQIQGFLICPWTIYLPRHYSQDL